MRKVFSFHCTQQAETLITWSGGYMFSGLFSLRGSLNHWNISSNSKNVAFFVPLFTHLSASFLPWLNFIPDLSLLSFSLLLSSLSLIFLWISVVPLSRLFFFPLQFHLCVLSHTGGWGVCWLFFAGCLCVFCLVSSEYQLLSLVMEANLIHTYIYKKK